MNVFKWLFSWRYRYFRHKLRGVEKMIMDLEFKKFKTLEIREEIRQTHDSMKTRLNVLETTIKSEDKKPTLNKDERARLDDQKVVLTRDIERYVAQMKDLDLQIAGSKPTNELPDGHNGIDQQLDALQELKLMVRDYLELV